MTSKISCAFFISISGKNYTVNPISCCVDASKYYLECLEEQNLGMVNYTKRTHTYTYSLNIGYMVSFCHLSCLQRSGGSFVVKPQYFTKTDGSVCNLSSGCSCNNAVVAYKLEVLHLCGGTVVAFPW